MSSQIVVVKNANVLGSVGEDKSSLSGFFPILPVSFKSMANSFRRILEDAVPVFKIFFKFSIVFGSVFVSKVTNS